MDFTTPEAVFIQGNSDENDKITLSTVTRNVPTICRSLSISENPFCKLYWQRNNHTITDEEEADSFTEIHSSIRVNYDQRFIRIDSDSFSIGMFARFTTCSNQT